MMANSSEHSFTTREEMRMKKIVAIAASFACVLAFGAKAQAGELLDENRFMASLEDAYEGHNYSNTHSLESFVTALGDSRHGHYRNTHNAGSFIAALEDGFRGYNYRNVHNYESFVAALGDGHEGYYRNTHNAASFVAALEDGYSSGRQRAAMAGAASERPIGEKHDEETVTAAYSPRPCQTGGMDFLSDATVLAKLSAECK